jgi:hypothetical protein
MIRLGLLAARREQASAILSGGQPGGDHLAGRVIRRTLVVSLSVSHAGNWGKILIPFRHTLH